MVNNGFNKSETASLVLRYRRAVLAVAALALVLIGVAGFAVLRISQMGAELKQLATEDLKMQRFVTRMVEYRLEEDLAMETARRYGLEMRMDPSKRDQFDTAAGRFEQLSAAVEAEIEAAELALNAPRAEEGVEARDIQARAAVALDGIGEAHMAYVGHARLMLAGLRAGDIDAVQAIAATLDIRAEQVDAKFGGLVEGMESLASAGGRGDGT